MAAAHSFAAMLMMLAILPATSLSIVTKIFQKDKVTPVEKVMELLINLRTKIEEEGKKEAAAYDKYACFCKEQADKKIHAIEESDKMIKYTGLRIDDIKDTIPTYTAEITELGKNASDFEDQLTKGRDARDVDHKAYLAAEKDLADAIDAATDAIKALKDSKEELKDAKLDFAQLKELTKPVLALLQGLPNHIKGVDIAVLEQLSQDPAKYEYHSNDIISLLQELRKTLLGRKQELDLTELEDQEVFSKKDTNLKNLLKFAKKDKAKREAQLDKMDADLNDLSLKKKIEERDVKMDRAFLDDLSAQCETKATLWDQRSSTRDGEITAITKALEALKEKVAPNYKANKKLVDIQVKARAAPLKNTTSTNMTKVKLQSNTSAARLITAKNIASNLSKLALIQLSDSRNTDSSEALVGQKLQRATEILSKAAKSLKSQMLSVALIRVQAQAGKDHFVKVRTLIKDLIARLEKDAGEEATTKSFCDKSMSESLEQRDKAQLKVESLTAEDSKLTAEKDTLNSEIATLSGQVADLKKALNEASELRSDERKDNEVTIGDAEEGKAGVQLALSTLEDFYKSGGALVQAHPYQDRNRKTVADLAPGGVFDTEYKGAQESSKGIIGMLNVILSDFERTIASTKDDEKEAQDEFSKLESTSNDDIKAKTDSKDTKGARITSIEDEKLQTANSLKEQNDLLEEASDSLVELKKQCVDATESYEERVESREKEIEALKQAMEALENWQG